MASKIIKGDEFADPIPERPVARPARPGVVEAEVYDAHQKARDIIAAAERQAEAIVAKANAERDAVREAAVEEGRQEGLAQTTEVIVKAKQQAGRILQGGEADIVQVGLMAAERIIGKAIELDEDTLLHITAQAIEAVRQQRELVLRVNPEDGTLLRNSRKKLMDILGRTKDIAVKDDPEVQRGGCIIETEHGTVDAQLSTQLQMLELALLGER